jgi:hypothetical protein
MIIPYWDYEVHYKVVGRLLLKQNKELYPIFSRPLAGLFG